MKCKRHFLSFISGVKFPWNHALFKIYSFLVRIGIQFLQGYRSQTILQFSILEDWESASLRTVAMCNSSYAASYSFPEPYNNILIKIARPTYIHK